MGEQGKHLGSKKVTILRLGILSHPPPLCGKMMGFQEREKEPLFPSFFPVV